MLKQSFIYSVSLALTIALGFATDAAFATKLNAPPLPHERDAKDFSGDDSETVIPPTATRFTRRHDYREDDAKKKEADETAKKTAADNVKKAQDARVDAYKKAIQTSVDANNNAVNLGKQGRWQEAIAEHEKACQYDPRNKQFRINLSAARTAYGQQCMAKGQLTSAASLFRKALAATSDNALAGRCLVECLKKMGYDPSSADTRIKIGDQLAGAGDIEGASIEYTAAMQLEPSARTYIKMGDMAYRYGQASQATNWYRQAIVKDPDCGAAHRQLGFLEMAQRDYTAAAASLRKALILDSKDTAAGVALVDIWRRQVAANPLLAENHLGLAGAMQLTGDFVGAESEYRKLEALDAKNPGLESGRNSLAHAIQHARAEKNKLAAETLFSQGLRREALMEINQAVSLEPRNASYQYMLGQCLESVGDFQGAHQAYLTCVLIDPENNKEAAAHMSMMQRRGLGMNQTQVNQAASRIAGQYSQQTSAPAVMAPQQQQMQAAPQQSMAPMQDANRKSMYEGAGSSNWPNPSQAGFRTHDESPEAVASAQQQRMAAMQQQAAAQQQAAMQQRAAMQQQQQQQAAAPAAGADDVFARVTDAEAQKDYNTAISLLRDLSAANLQNPEVHHRLAINLLASGQISEAISEFRIASALCPSKKAYSEDLARALAIHKTSLMSDASPATQSANGVTGASK